MAKLGPELFARLNRRQHVGNQTPVVYGQGGMAAADIQDVERKLGFRMPEDFSYFLRNVRDPGPTLFPWATFNIESYNEAIGWILAGIEFDVEHGEWLRRWGKRPKSLGDALRIVRADFNEWPRLLPVCGHRFLAAEPLREGNPVFSIMQTDIVYYGSNLADYLENEFLSSPPISVFDLDRIKRVDVWSDFAEGREPHLGLIRR